MKKAIFLFSLLGFALSASGQTADSIVKPALRPSPLALASLKTGEKYIKIVYSQPMKKGRTIFGENGLVPYGKLWRTGANEATEITFTKDAKIGGKVIKSGTYTLFSIPNESTWTIIFNTDLGQWGDYKYNPSKDILRFDVPCLRSLPMYEAFTILTSENDTGAEVKLLWDDVKVSIPIQFLGK